MADARAGAGADADVRDYVLGRFAGYAGLDPGELSEGGLTLAGVIARSEQMTNSIDLLEAFARTSNAVAQDYGVRVRLPALPLDTPVPEALQRFLGEFLQQKGGQA